MEIVYYHSLFRNFAGPFKKIDDVVIGQMVADQSRYHDIITFGGFVQFRTRTDFKLDIRRGWKPFCKFNSQGIQFNSHNFGIGEIAGHFYAVKTSSTTHVQN